MKIARVNLEACVWGDVRFPRLEHLLSYPPCRGHLAIARMAIIWGWQVENYTPDAPCFHVPEDVIEMALEVDGPTAIAALVRARLAEETPDGVRMKGSSHEATGWLWRIRHKSAAGGEAKAKKAKTKRTNSNERDVSVPEAEHGNATGMPQESPLSSLLSDRSGSLSLGERAGATGTAPEAEAEPDEPPTQAPVGRGPLAPMHRLAKLALELLNDARYAIQPNVRPLPLDAAAESAAAQCLRSLPEGDREPAIRHGVEVIAAAVKAGVEPIGKLRPGELFGPKSFGQWQAATVDDFKPRTASARGRDGPAARASPAAGYAPPAPAASHGTGLVDPRSIRPP